jgi:single-stranded-DNA-specific exonuclease
MTPELMAVVDRLEPYGNAAPELCFLVRKAKIVGANIVGKGERTHLKLTLQCGAGPKAVKWPAMYWGASARYKRDFTDGDLVDMVFTVVRNSFNGSETIEMRVQDMEKSG